MCLVKSADDVDWRRRSMNFHDMLASRMTTTRVAKLAKTKRRETFTK
jgi:hypothetical protein